MGLIYIEIPGHRDMAIQPGDCFTVDFPAFHNDEHGKEYGHRTVNPKNARKAQQQQAADDARCGPGVGLKVLAAGLRHGDATD